MAGIILEKSAVEDILKSVLEKENLQDGRLQINRGMEKGDGFLSNITQVNITGANKKLDVVIKCAPLGEMRKVIPLRDVFLREIYMYDKVLDAFKKFQFDRNVPEPFTSFPNVYKTTTEENAEKLILEDIRKNGFKLWNKATTMTHDHVVLVFQQYAKFHALSYAMKELEPDKYNMLTKNLNSLFKAPNGPKEQDPMFIAIEKAIKLYSEGTDAWKLLHKLKDNIFNFMSNIDKCNEDKSVIIHGDCWCNNMMFKYISTKPVELCLLDFQISMVSSPATDLSYFFYVSASKELMDNLEFYLRIYHNSLVDHLKSMGATKFISFADFKKEWKMYSRYGLIMALLMIRIMLTAKNEIIDMTDLENKKASVDQLVTGNIKNNKVLDQRLRIVIDHFVSNNFL